MNPKKTRSAAQKNFSRTRVPVYDQQQVFTLSPSTPTIRKYPISTTDHSGGDCGHTDNWSPHKNNAKRNVRVALCLSRQGIQSMVKFYSERMNTAQYLARRIRAERRWRKKEREYQKRFPWLYTRDPRFPFSRKIMKDGHLSERTRKWLQRLNRGLPVLETIPWRFRMSRPRRQTPRRPAMTRGKSRKTN